MSLPAVTWTVGSRSFSERETFQAVQNDERDNGRQPVGGQELPMSCSQSQHTGLLKESAVAVLKLCIYAILGCRFRRGRATFVITQLGRRLDLFGFGPLDSAT